MNLSISMQDKISLQKMILFLGKLLVFGIYASTQDHSSLNLYVTTNAIIHKLIAFILLVNWF